jgi:hypothetical protein
MDRMNVTLNIQANSIGQRRVNVRSSLVVANLVATVKDKFNLDGNFEVRLDNSRIPLADDAALDAAGVQDGSTLAVTRVMEATGTIDAIERGLRERLSKNFKRVYLAEERTLAEFDLYWQPAVIGRRDYRNPSKNRLLAADLEELEGTQTVSRHHAAISESGGSFFLESVNPYNPTFLGDMRLRMGVLYPLPAGSRIRVGQIVLTFHIIG